MTRCVAWVLGACLACLSLVGCQTDIYGLQMLPPDDDVTVVQGDSVTAPLQLVTVRDPDDEVRLLRVDGLPADATATFEPDTFEGDRAEVTIATTVATPPGSYLVEVVAQEDGHGEDEVDMRLVVLPRGLDLSFRVTPSRHTFTSLEPREFAVAVTTADDDLPAFRLTLRGFTNDFVLVEPEQTVLSYEEGKVQVHEELRIRLRPTGRIDVAFIKVTLTSGEHSITRRIRLSADYRRVTDAQPQEPSAGPVRPGG